MTDRKALAREIAKRKPPRFVEVKRERRAMPEGQRPRLRQDDLMEYEAAIRFIAWKRPQGVDL